MGDPGSILDAAAAIKEAVDGVKEAERNPNQGGVAISSTTLESLGICMKALETIYPKVSDAVKAAKALESNPDADIPTIGDISGSSQGDADTAAIVAPASWDKWVLESDQQLEFAVNNGIGGARNYRLALRKHAINGKQLAQSQAATVKAGQEYVQAVMEVISCNQDIKTLRDLLDRYQGQAEIYAQAEAKFFDRFLAMRTGLAIELRNMVWAYKFWALADSQVILDSQKSVADFRADIYFLEAEIEAVRARYSTDFQRKRSAYIFVGQSTNNTIQRLNSISRRKMLVILPGI